MTPPRIGSLCSGYRGLDMAVETVFGGTTVWHADIDPGASAILAHHWPATPNLGDISAVDWGQVEPVDILAGGFPCQDLSLAGLRAGLKHGNRSGLWHQVARAIHALRPRLVVIENVRGLLSADAHGDVEPCPWCVGDSSGEPVLRALGAVLADLASLGFDAEWQVVRASEVGAPHQRERVFILAWPAAENSDSAARDQRGLAAPGQAESGRARADASRRGGAPTADAHSGGQRPDLGDVLPGQPGAPRCPASDAQYAGLARLAGPGSTQSGEPLGESAGHRAVAPTNTQGRGDAHRPVGDPPVQLLAEPGPGTGADAGNPAAGTDEPMRGASVLAWGNYEPAIRRWERALGRPAPAAVDARNRLSPVFVEWLMGLPAGHVTAVPGLSRTAQLKALGNGVVPQQAEAAIRLLAARAAA